MTLAPITDEFPTGMTEVPDGFTNIVKVETVAAATAATASTTESKNNTDYWKDVVESNSTGNAAAYVYFVDPDSCRE